MKPSPPSDKSHVSLGQRQCPVCGVVEDDGTILIHKQLRQTLDRYTVTGFSLCKEHKRLHAEGFIALIELSAEPDPKSTLQESWPLRTGNLAHLKREAWAQIFDTPAPAGPLCFVTPDVMQLMVILEAKLQKEN